MELYLSFSLHALMEGRDVRLCLFLTLDSYVACVVLYVVFMITQTMYLSVYV